MDYLHIKDFLYKILSSDHSLEEKWMFGGTCLMLNDKMLICINERDLLCRIGEEKVTEEIEKGTCRHMMMNGRTSKDYVYVELDSLYHINDVQYWLKLCLEYNPKAKTSKKKI
jgi:TfoX/Sxy family transcriptional regulator of competence genes